MKRHGLKLLISAALALAFVFLLRAAAFELIPDASAFENVRWWTVPAYFALFSLVHLVRAARWQFLLKPLHETPLKKVMAASFIGFAAIILFPLRTGEMVRPVLIRKKGHISGWAATGTIAAERIIDGLFLSIVLLMALSTATALDPLPDKIGELNIPVSIVPRSAYFALGIFTAAFIAMGLFFFARDFATRLVNLFIGPFSKRLAEWLSGRVLKVADGLKFLPSAKLSAAFVLTTAAYWLTNAAASWLLAWGVGFDSFSYAEACVLTGILALGILIPNVPGFFGQFQLALFAALSMFYPYELVSQQGAAYVFLAYCLQMGVTGVFALVGTAWFGTPFREVLGTASSEEFEETAA